MNQGGLASKNKNNKAQGGPAPAEKEVRMQNNVKKIKRVPLGLEPRSPWLHAHVSTTGVAIHPFINIKPYIYMVKTFLRPTSSSTSRPA